MNAGGPADLSAEVEGWQPDQLAAVKQPLEAVMDAQRLRIEYAETRRAALGVLGGVVLAAGLAGLIQLGDGKIKYVPAEVGLLVLTGALALTGVLILVVYGRQTTWPYPFKADLASTWKWFYRDAIPEASEVVPRWHGRQSEDFKRRSKDAFSATRPAYVRRMLTLADPKTDLLQDLEQAHLLSWNEFYKNRFLEHLRAVVIRGVVASVGLGVVAFLVTLLVRICS